MLHCFLNYRMHQLVSHFFVVVSIISLFHQQHKYSPTQLSIVLTAIMVASVLKIWFLEKMLFQLIILHVFRPKNLTNRCNLSNALYSTSQYRWVLGKLKTRPCLDVSVHFNSIQKLSRLKKKNVNRANWPVQRLRYGGVKLSVKLLCCEQIYYKNWHKSN